MYAALATSLSSVAIVVGGYVFLDDRHAHQDSHLDLKGTVEQTVAGIDLRFLQNQLAGLELTGSCEKPEYKKLCEHLRAQIATQTKK